MNAQQAIELLTHLNAFPRLGEVEVRRGRSLTIERRLLPEKPSTRRAAELAGAGQWQLGQELIAGNLLLFILKCVDAADERAVMPGGRPELSDFLRCALRLWLTRPSIAADLINYLKSADPAFGEAGAG